MASLDRRSLIAGAAALAAMPATSNAATIPPMPASMTFAILRNGKPFGQYKVAFARSGELMNVTTDVAMGMKLSGVTVFDYKHHCEEVWKDGQFLELRSNSVRDRSETNTVNAIRQQFGVHIATNKGPLGAPLDATPLTHWNQSALKGRLFNPQDGLMLDLNVQLLGKDAVTLANGSKVIANHWAIRGSQTIDEWYDDAGVWMGLRAVFPDKSIIEYRRV